MWHAFSPGKARVQYMPVRFLDRELAIEYTSYELKRIIDMKKSISTLSKDLTGYAVWLNRRKSFLIVPTLSSPEPKVFCEIPDWIEIPVLPNNALVTVRGAWKYRRARIMEDGNVAASPVFSVEHYTQVKPDMDSFKPDISFYDFRDMLFDPLRNVDYYMQDLIAHSFVSSPKTMNRIGGLTLSFYNESKGTSGVVVRHLKRFLPKELGHQHEFPIHVEEIGHSLKINPFPWYFKQYNADANLTSDTMNLLQRSSNLPIEEISISLRSENAAPKTLRDAPLTMSDVPIVMSKDVERTREFIDPSPEVFKFMLSTHMVPVSLSQEAYQFALEYARERISLTINSRPVLQNELGKGGILDMNIHGKPQSLLHLALSKSRSNIAAEVTKEMVKKAVMLFEDNLSDTFDKWSQAFPDQGRQDFSWASVEQRMIVGYIIKSGPSNPERVFSFLRNEMSRNTFDRMWQELYVKGAIYEKDPRVYAVAPFLRQ